jgi:hypothetical protein
MKVKTTVDVNCPIKGKVEIYNGKLIGNLLTVVMFPNAVANWEYQKEDGTPIMSGTSTFTTEQADALLTSPITSMEVAEQVFYGAMKVEMAQTFGISVNDFVNI